MNEFKEKEVEIVVEYMGSSFLSSKDSAATLIGILGLN
jgi:hypothetical protein